MLPSRSRIPVHTITITKLQKYGTIRDKNISKHRPLTVFHPGEPSSNWHCYAVWTLNILHWTSCPLSPLRAVLLIPVSRACTYPVHPVSPGCHSFAAATVGTHPSPGSSVSSYSCTDPVPPVYPGCRSFNCSSCGNPSSTMVPHSLLLLCVFILLLYVIR